jgi:NADP-dependent 3-hydroxy acid dehydrogenase YdfG
MGKLVFITGASSGIGQALAWRFCLAGYSLALVARRTEETLAWAQSMNIQSDRYKIYSADVSVVDSIVAAGQACLAQQGVPDVVIASAGISVGVDTAERGDIDVMVKVLATNTVGTAATFHPFIEPMTRRGSGALVGIGSVAGIRGLPGHGAYCASKAGVIAIAKACAVSCVSWGSGGHHLPGLHRYPTDAEKPLRHAIPDAGGCLCRQGFSSHRSGCELLRDSLADGGGCQTDACAAQWLFDRVLAGRPRKHRSNEV